jgi:dienelactone hydrolase
MNVRALCLLLAVLVSGLAKGDDTTDRADTRATRVATGQTTAHVPATGPIKVSSTLNAAATQATSSPLSSVAAAMNETVIRIPADPSGAITLETTVFKPDGIGPFPLVVFNHGRDGGDPHIQKRSRPLSFAREFVRRGYEVAVPNRRGFAKSDGDYPDTGCDIAADGLLQARDIAATVDFLRARPSIDASKILVAGISHGGFASLAYDRAPAPGVRGVVNFAGGLRKDDCANGSVRLTEAFADYGEAGTRGTQNAGQPEMPGALPTPGRPAPTLWFYGANDRVFDAALVTRLYQAYTTAGGKATLVRYGDYKNDAHELVGDRDAVPIWWPATQRFLERVGLPFRVRYRVEEASQLRPTPSPSGFAALDAVNVVPFLDDTGRVAYLSFLGQAKPRTFALSRSGQWAWAAGGDDPFAEAIDNCTQKSPTPCKPYAIDDYVVWQRR